jgi:putative zinc finger/helix-turn-helix YgiT family protein
MKTGKKSPPSRGRVLPNDACPECATLTVPSRAKLDHPVNGERVAVSRIPHRRCPECSEVLLSLDAAMQLRGRAQAEYRKKHGLLNPDEIRELRDHLGLTQVQLADLLRLGANTVPRWESGKVVQSSSMDTLLRLVRDVPDTRAYLEKLAA